MRVRAEHEGPGVTAGGHAPPQRQPDATPAPGRPHVQPLLNLQGTAGNAAVARMLAGPGTDEAEALVDRHTSWGTLDEAALGAELLQRARQGGHALVERVLDRLGGTDRDDVSVEFTRLAGAPDLTAFVAAATGRHLLDRLFDEITSGSVGAAEQAQADRILQAKASLVSPEGFARQVQGGKVFPFRLPGLTVLNDAPITAERRERGLIYVKQPVRVLGTDRFRGETATLPTQVFTSGIELPENEIVGVRLYDLGGPVVYKPALFLVQLSNETDTTILTKMAEAAGIGLSLGVGELVALGVEASLAVRVLAIADRAAAALGTLATVLLEHRGELIARFGDTGRAFVQYVEYVQSAAALYGLARVVLSMGQLVGGLRRAHEQWRGALQAADDLDPAESGAFQAINREAENLVRQADAIEQARPGPAAAPTAAPAAGPPAAAAAPKPAPAQQGGFLDEIFGPQYDFSKTDAMRDPVAHAHIFKLRQLAIDALADSGPNQPVKVVPLRYNPAISVKGDFTQAKFVVGRTPEELAQVLGVAEFVNGVRIYRLDKSAITVDNILLRGYTQSPAGKSPTLQTPQNLAKYPPGLGAPQWSTAADIPATPAGEFTPGTPARF